MAPQNIGDVVTVRGEAYRLADYSNVSHLGSKFFGKMSFDLVKVSDGSRWGYCGKRVTVNAKLSPVATAEPEPEPETCDHSTGQIGCALVTCQGVPVGVDVHTAETVTAEPVGYESGHAAFARDMAHAMRRYGLSVTLPTTFESRGWDYGSVRKVSGYDLTVNGHAVRVLSYESRGQLSSCGMPYAAVYVGGQIISSEQPMWGGSDKVGHAIAYAVARHVETLPEPVAEPVAAEVPAPAEVGDFSGTVRLADAPEKIGAEVPEPVGEPVAAEVSEPVAVPAEPVCGQRRGYGQRVTRTVANRREGACDWCGLIVPAARGEARLLDVGGWVVVHPDSQWQGSPVSGGYVGGCPPVNGPEVPPVAEVAEVAPEVAEPVADPCAEVARRLSARFGVAGTSHARRVSVDHDTRTGAVTVAGIKGDADTVSAVFGRPYRFGGDHTPEGGYRAVYVPATPEPVAEAEPEPTPAGDGQAAHMGAHPAEPEPDAEAVGSAIMGRALAAVVAEDWQAVAEAVADGESRAPGYREAGASGTVYGWADVRTGIPTPAEPVAEAEPDVLQMTTDGEADAFPVDAPSVADRTPAPVAEPEPEPEQGQLFACADTRAAARRNFGSLGMIDGLGNITADALAEPTPAEPVAEPAPDYGVAVDGVLVAVARHVDLTAEPDAEATPEPVADLGTVAEAEPVDPWAGLDTVDSDALAVALAVVADVTPDDGDTLYTIGDACDRAQNRETAEAAAVAEAAARAPRHPSRARQVRRDYAEAVGVWFVQAETGCRGHLLSAAGRAAGIDPRSLWSGPAARVERYASEELREWFGTHGRVTAGQWRTQHAEARPVPGTAAEVVAGWSASDADGVPVPVSSLVTAGGGAEPERLPLAIRGNVARVAYPAGMPVRSTLKAVRPEVLRRTRDAGLKSARCSIVPDRDAREVSVTLEGADGPDAVAVWRIVAEVLAAHGFTPAEVAAGV